MSDITYLHNTNITCNRMINCINGEQKKFEQAGTWKEKIIDIVVNFISNFSILDGIKAKLEANRAAAYQYLAHSYENIEIALQAQYPDFNDLPQSTQTIIKLHALCVNLATDQAREVGEDSDQSLIKKFELCINSENIELRYDSQMLYSIKSHETLLALTQQFNEVTTAQAATLDMNEIDSLFSNNEPIKAFFALTKHEQHNCLLRKRFNGENSTAHSCKNFFTLKKEASHDVLVNDLFSEESDMQCEAFFALKSRMSETSLFPFTVQQIDLKNKEASCYIGPFKLTELNRENDSYAKKLTYLYHHIDTLNSDLTQRNTFTKHIKASIDNNQNPQNKGSFIIDVARQNAHINGIRISYDCAEQNKIVDDFMATLTPAQSARLDVIATQTFLADFFTSSLITDGYFKCFDKSTLLNYFCEKNGFDVDEQKKQFAPTELEMVTFIDKENSTGSLTVNRYLHNYADKDLFLAAKENAHAPTTANSKAKKNYEDSFTEEVKKLDYHHINFDITFTIDPDGTYTIDDFNIKAKPAVVPSYGKSSFNPLLHEV